MMRCLEMCWLLSYHYPGSTGAAHNVLLLKLPSVSQWLLCTVTITLQDGATALFIACQNGHVSTVQLLVDAGASLDVRTNVSSLPTRYTYTNRWW